MGTQGCPLLSADFPCNPAVHISAATLRWTRATQGQRKIQGRPAGGRTPSMTPEPASLPHGMEKGTGSRSSMVVPQ
jgi:hypothetical protein